VATVGAYVRIDSEKRASIRDGLARIDGVEPFDLDAPGTLGLIVVADSVDGAHAILTQQVRSIEGVLGAWPLYANVEDEQAEHGAE
jgi:nitrate reductase NapAB chaperone NapD